MIRVIGVAAFALLLAGCTGSGAAEASGDTSSLVKEIPPPQGDQKEPFKPAGNSLLKTSPSDMPTPPDGKAAPTQPSAPTKGG